MSSVRVPKPGEHPCKYEGNYFIECLEHDKCETCGWNPEVYARRKERINAKYNVRSIGDIISELHAKFKAGLITREAAWDEMDKYKRIIFKDSV